MGKVHQKLEYMFEVLPDDGYSIRVGYTDSKADHNLKNVDEVRALIRKIIDQ